MPPLFLCSRKMEHVWLNLEISNLTILLDISAAAKEQAPCIIFIDEFDSVGAKRTSSAIHPYANQTVNQLLNEMDG